LDQNKIRVDFRRTKINTYGAGGKAGRLCIPSSARFDLRVNLRGQSVAQAMTLLGHNDSFIEGDNHMKRLFCKSAALALVFAWTPAAFATSAETVLDIDGDPSCKALSNNDSVLEAKDPEGHYYHLDGTAAGPDGQVFSYSIDKSGKNLSWTTSHAKQDPQTVNFVILSSKGKHWRVSRVFHFGTEGVFLDNDEEARGTIKTVRFCYGLAPPPAELAECKDVIDDFTCPAVGQRLVTIQDPESPDFDTRACTCNTTFTECDPTLSVGEPNACPDSAGFNERVPVVIQAVEDPNSYVCYTIGGQRRCFRH